MVAYNLQYIYGGDPLGALTAAIDCYCLMLDVREGLDLSVGFYSLPVALNAVRSTKAYILHALSM